MWSDYFEPDFCDPDSSSYVETSPYLPTGEIDILDCQQEVDDVLWDFRDAFRVVRNLEKSKYDRLRDIAVRIDNDDRLWKDYSEFESETETEIKPVSQYIFTFGKYKGRTLQAVLDRDPSYIEWCRNNVAWFNH